MSVAAKSRLGVGASLLRKEDDRHLLGRGHFVADVKLRIQQPCAPAAFSTSGSIVSASPAVQLPTRVGMASRRATAASTSADSCQRCVQVP